ncbi:MAG: sensor histidine kinase [Nocardioides sp.]
MLGLAMPAVLAFAITADASPPSSMSLGLAFSVAELPMLMFAIHQLLTQRKGTSLIGSSELLPLVAMPPCAATAAPTPRSDDERLHELRATVAGIVMTHRLLRDESYVVSVDTRERLEYLEDAELARLERMVSDGTPRDLTGVRLGPMIEPIIESLRLRGNTILWSGSAAVAMTRPDDVSEIVHILLENAVVHAPGARVSVQVASHGEVTLVSVADRGPGVPLGTRELVFARGFRASDRPGHGLGLHIARRLAREMGGELRLDTTPGGGATFVLELVTSTVGAKACHAHSA